MIGKRPKGYRKSWRPCTCHPDDNPPVPCARRYALSDCLASATQPPSIAGRDPRCAPDVSDEVPGRDHESVLALIKSGEREAALRKALEAERDGLREALANNITITRAEARRLVNYAFMASSAKWTPFIQENGVSGTESPWGEFLRIADRLWTVMFPDHPIRQSDPRLPVAALSPPPVGGKP